MSNLSKNLLRTSSLFSKAINSTTQVIKANYHEKVTVGNSEAIAIMSNCKLLSIRSLIIMRIQEMLAL